jgi:putative MATE family efflux protein
MKGTGDLVQLGEYGVNALALAFPIQMLIVALGVGTGVGINALLARRLGEGNYKEANKVAGNSVFLGLIMYVIFLLFGLFGVDVYISSQTNHAIVLEMGVSYLRICSILSFGMIFYMIYEKLLQATGKTTLTTISQIAGAVVNMILDPFMILGIGIFPKMGIQGAAYATVIGQMVSFIMNMYCHYRLDKELQVSIKDMIPNLKIIVDIYEIGLPAIIMQAVMSIMTYGVNLIFGTVSQEAVTAYGIYYKIQQFVIFMATGMNNAVIPLIGFNYGKKDYQRVNDIIKYSVLYTSIIMMASFILFQLFANQLVNIFSLADDTARLCILAIRVISIGYIFLGANIIYQGVLQSLGFGIPSLVISIIRQIIVPLPLAFILSKLQNGTYLMWTSFPIAEFITIFIAIVLIRKVKNKYLNQI